MGTNCSHQAVLVTGECTSQWLSFPLGSVIRNSKISAFPLLGKRLLLFFAMSFSCLGCAFNNVQGMRGFLYPNGFRCLFSLILEMEERTKAELHAFLSLAALVIPSMRDAFLDLSLCTWSFLSFFFFWCKPGEALKNLWMSCGLHGFCVFLLAHTQPLGIY